MTPARDPKQEEEEAEPKQSKKAIQQSNPREHSRKQPWSAIQASSPGEQHGSIPESIQESISESIPEAFQFQEAPDAFQKLPKASRSLQTLPSTFQKHAESFEEQPDAFQKVRSLLDLPEAFQASKGFGQPSRSVHKPPRSLQNPFPNILEHEGAAKSSHEQPGAARSS